MQYRKYGAFTSSSSPEEFSLTIASALRILVTVVGTIAAFKGIHFVVDDASLQQFADALVTVATSAIAIYHAGQFIVGLIRKLSAKSVV